MSELRIGTRGSPLALVQANLVRDLIVRAHDLDPAAVTIHPIRTTGDNIQDKPLTELGGKGLFTKEIETALLEGKIDLAVHSMKDVATALPEGLIIGAMLKREDARDAFISLKAADFMDLPEGAVIGTSSLRRKSQVLHARPDLKVVDFRGNVETRLRKLNEGVADATFLAFAGLKRLGLEAEIAAPMPTDKMLPALAQGAIGIEILQTRDDIKKMITPLNDDDTQICVNMERSFLAALDGSCRTPIAGLAEIEDGLVNFRGMIISPDGAEVHENTRKIAIDEAQAAGHDAGLELKTRGGADFFDMV